jgi:hypothetical protein
MMYTKDLTTISQQIDQLRWKEQFEFALLCSNEGDPLGRLFKII